MKMKMGYVLFGANKQKYEKNVKNGVAYSIFFRFMIP